MQKTVAILAVTAFLASASPGLAAPDCNRNGVPDRIDVRTGTSADCNRNDVPDECDVAEVNFGLELQGEHEVASRGPVAIADLDGDGDLDIAAGGASGAVQALWNDAGQFPEHRTLHTGAGDAVSFLIAADLEGDGDIDLFLNARDSVVVLENRGQGAIETSRAVPLPAPAPSAAVADFDGDGDADLAAVLPFALALFTNTGAGFTSNTTFGIGARPVAVISGDLDGDGDIDLATANALAGDLFPDTVSVLINDGKGSFSSPRNFATLRGASALLLADVDGDEDADLVVTSRPRRKIGFLLNQGDGRFEEGSGIALAVEPAVLVARDLDGDGSVDLVGSSADTPELFVLLNHGEGFAAPVLLSLLAGSAASRHLASRDLDGDGAPEVVVSGGGENGRLRLFTRRFVALRTDCNGNGLPDDCELASNDCNATGLPDECELAENDCDRNGVPDTCDPDCNANLVPDACDIASGRAADCNRNGVPDACDVAPTPAFSAVQRLVSGAFRSPLVVAIEDGGDPVLVLADPGTSTVMLFGSIARDGFRRPDVIDAGAVGHALVSGDFDGDGSVDLAKGSVSGAVSVIFNDGDGAFSEPFLHVVPGAVDALAAGDINGDERDDVVAASGGSSLSALTGRAGGSFTTTWTTRVASPVTRLFLADFDGDSHVDIAAVRPASFEITLLRGDGRGGFEFHAALNAGSGIVDAMAADFDGDGAVDIAAVNRSGGLGGLPLFWNDGKGQFSRGATIPSLFISSVSRMVAHDVDLDGDVDLLLGAHFAGANGHIDVGLLRNTGNRRFELALRLPPPLRSRPPVELTTGDFDRDSLPEIVAFYSNNDGSPDGELTIFWNRSAPAPSADENGNTIPDECEAVFHRGDVDGDGHLLVNDAVFLLSFLFRAGEQPDCLEAADADNDARVLLTDAVYLLTYLFRGGAAPRAPGPPPAACGSDPDASGSPGDIGCDVYASCRDDRER